MNEDKRQTVRGDDLNECQINASAGSIDTVCSVCHELDTRVAAEGDCEDCSVHPCKPCIAHYGALKDAEHMVHPKVDSPRSLPRHAGHTAKCSDYLGSTVEYFCTVHDEVVCHVDVILDHVTCGVQYIPKLAQGIGTSSEMAELRASLRELKQQSKDIEDQTKGSIATLKIKGKEYNDFVVQTGHEAVEHINYLVQKAVEENEKFTQSISLEMNRSVITCQQIGKEVSVMEAKLEDSSVSESQLFHLLKSSLKSLVGLKEQVAKSKHYAKPMHFSFKENTEIKKVKELQALGERIRTIQIVEKSYVDTDIRLPDDIETPDVTDIQILQDGRIAVVDIGNDSVKLIKRNGKQIEQVKLQSKPWAVAQTDEGDLVVTLPETNQLQFLTIGKSVASPYRIFNTDFPPGGIAADQDKLIVCSENKIVMLDRDCNTIRTVHRGEENINGFMCLTFNPSAGLLYASDHKAREVKCLTMEGEIKGTYKLEYDLGNTTVLDDGSVLVTGCDGIHHITGTGNEIRLLTDWRVIGHGFAVISYDKGDRQLYLAGQVLRQVKIE